MNSALNLFWIHEAVAARSPVGPMQLSDGNILPDNGMAGDAVNVFTNQLLPQIANFVLGAVLSVSVIMVIVGGIMFIYSGGDQEKRTKGRDFIVYALIGVGVAALSYVVVSMITGVNYLNAS